MAGSRGFVRVAPGGAGLALDDGRPFPVAGANCYYLLVRLGRAEDAWLDWRGSRRRRRRCLRQMPLPACVRLRAVCLAYCACLLIALAVVPPPTVQTRAADPGLRHECSTVLDDAAAAGLNVVRCWAFADGEQWNALQVRRGTRPCPAGAAWQQAGDPAPPRLSAGALRWQPPLLLGWLTSPLVSPALPHPPTQPRPGVFDERVFRGLDWLLAEAGRRGLRLLLVRCCGAAAAAALHRGALQAPSACQQAKLACSCLLRTAVSLPACPPLHRC